MNIKPTTPEGARPRDPQHLESNRTSETGKPDPTSPAARERRPTAAGVDSVNVSPEAKALAEGSESRAGGSSLSPDRLKEIGERLASGYYDRREVIDQVARRVGRDPDLRIEE